MHMTHSVSENSPTSMKAVVQEYGEIFSYEFWTMKEFQAKLTVQEGFKRRFCHPKPARPPDPIIR